MERESNPEQPMIQYAMDRHLVTLFHAKLATLACEYQCGFYIGYSTDKTPAALAA